MQLFAADDARPLVGAVVFIYHTDEAGHYDRPGLRGWRLHAWARSDAAGRVAFLTVRPGPYPGRDVAAHVHVGLDGPQGQRHLLPDVLFAGDPRLTVAQQRASTAAGRHANIRPVTMVEGRATVDIRYRLPGEFVF